MGRTAKDAALVWERRIERQRRSGLSIAEFCSGEGVSTASFYVWRRRLRDEDSLRRPSSLFVPVELSSPPITASVRIELPGGAVLSLPVDAPLELLTAAIRAALPSAALPSAAAAERPSC